VRTMAGGSPTPAFKAASRSVPQVIAVLRSSLRLRI